MVDVRAGSAPIFLAHAGERHGSSESEVEATSTHLPEPGEIGEDLPAESELHNQTEMSVDSNHPSELDLEGTSCSVDSCVHTPAGSESSAIVVAPATQSNTLLAPPSESLLGLFVGVPIALLVWKRKLWS